MPSTQKALRMQVEPCLTCGAGHGRNGTWTDDCCGSLVMEKGVHLCHSIGHMLLPLQPLYLMHSQHILQHCRGLAST